MEKEKFINLVFSEFKEEKLEFKNLHFRSFQNLGRCFCFRLFWSSLVARLGYFSVTAKTWLKPTMFQSGSRCWWWCWCTQAAEAAAKRVKFKIFVCPVFVLRFRFQKQKIDFKAQKTTLYIFELKSFVA